MDSYGKEGFKKMFGVVKPPSKDEHTPAHVAPRRDKPTGIRLGDLFAKVKLTVRSI